METPPIESGARTGGLAVLGGVAGVGFMRGAGAGEEADGGNEAEAAGWRGAAPGGESSVPRAGAGSCAVAS